MAPLLFYRTPLCVCVLCFITFTYLAFNIYDNYYYLYTPFVLCYLMMQKK